MVDSTLEFITRFAKPVARQSNYDWVWMGVIFHYSFPFNSDRNIAKLLSGYAISMVINAFLCLCVCASNMWNCELTGHDNAYA